MTSMHRRLNNSHMLGAISRAHTCNRRAGMLSGPHAFEVSRARKNCATSSTSSVISEIFPSLSVRGVWLQVVEDGRNTEEK